MQIVRIKGTEYHSAKTQAEVEQFLADSGLVKTGRHQKHGDTLLAMFNSPFRSFGYKQYCEPEYTARDYKDGWGICVKYFYEEDAISPPKGGRMTAEQFVQKFTKNNTYPVNVGKVYGGQRC
jgi:hypothetical protein